MPSHFNFLFLHIMQANRLGFGTLELPPAGAASGVRWSWSVLGSDTMMVSGGVAEDDDMACRSYPSPVQE